jgi:hypoxanthine phosphoribosyltransferase
MAELKVLISRQEIAKRVAELGEQITKDFAGQSVIFVGVLKGAAIFLADLTRQVHLDSTFDFIGVSSYGNRPSPASELKSGWDSTGEVRLLKDVDQSIKDKNIILVEEGDYVGFKIPDEFVVGFGLDYAERYRNLADICVVPRE